VSNLVTQHSEKLFDLSRLAAKKEAEASPTIDEDPAEENNDSLMIRKYFKPSTFGDLSDIPESSLKL